MGDRWKNRRKMAWMSLLSGIFFPCILLITPNGTDLATISIPFYTFISAVVASYVGFSTWDDVHCPEHNNEDD